MICKGGKYSVPGSPRVPARRAGEDKDASKAAVGKEGRLVREREAQWARALAEVRHGLSILTPTDSSALSRQTGRRMPAVRLRSEWGMLFLEGSLPRFSAGFLSPSEQPLGKIGAGASTADVN